MGGLKTLLGYWAEFRADDEAAAYGRYAGVLSQADLERVFLPRLREPEAGGPGVVGEHMTPGFALQLVTVRWLGTFLEDPPEGLGAVLDFWPGSWGCRIRQGTGLRKSGAGSLGPQGLGDMTAPGRSYC